MYATCNMSFMLEILASHETDLIHVEGGHLLICVPDISSLCARTYDTS